MENKDTVKVDEKVESEKILKNIDEKINELYSKLETVLISMPSSLEEAKQSSPLIEKLFATEDRLADLLKKIRI